MRDDGKKGQFVIDIDGKVLAGMTYVWAGLNKIIVDHTLADKSLQGKNVGKQLVHRAVLFGREKQIKILQLCPFASAVFAKTTDYKVEFYYIKSDSKIQLYRKWLTQKNVLLRENSIRRFFAKYEVF